MSDKINEWDREPDTVQGEGYCIVRHKSMGFLCGYVSVPEGHPWFKQGYDEVRGAGGEYVECHGGLTYADSSPPQGEDEGNWWLGFDCGHYEDLIPHMSKLTGLERSGSDTYRNLAYVIGECKSLLDQAEAVANDN